MSARVTTTVKWFDHKKGIGFLYGPSDDQDVFVHYRSIEPGTPGYKKLEDGETVEYLPVTTDRGLAAVEVTRVQ